MARSYIDPALVAMALEPVAPPWNWNPGATFVEAFNQAQKNRREQEKMELDKWMSDQLFPLQKQKVALELDKLQGEIERQTLLTQMSREAYKTTHQNLMNGMTSQDDAQTVDPRSAAYGLRTLFSQPAGSNSAPATKNLSWKVVRPPAPAATPTGP